MTEARRDGMRGVFNALVCGKDGCLVDARKIYSIRSDKVLLMDVPATSYLLLNKKLNMLDSRARHVPWRTDATHRSAYTI